MKEVNIKFLVTEFKKTLKKVYISKHTTSIWHFIYKLHFLKNNHFWYHKTWNRLKNPSVENCEKAMKKCFLETNKNNI